MTDTNLQKSELVISRILKHLLDHGLQQGTQLIFDDLDLPQDYGSIYNGCCVWLIEEGIIRCTNTSQAIGGGNLGMISPMITAKGFALLDQPLVVGDDEIRVGQAVKEVAGGQINYAGIGDFIGGVLGGFTKSMGS